MFIYSIGLKEGKKGQIFPILIVIVVILIIAALITANLGKVSLDRLYSINAADAGAIAGISDFTSGYNKASWANIAMLPVALAIQTYLLFPVCWYCWPYRHLWYVVANDFNDSLYEWARAMVEGYSYYVRKDAYYYAFINAGIDDKYKYDPNYYDPVTGNYRNRPLATETWEDWVRLDTAFSRWLNDLPDGWGNNSSLRYTWTNQSEWVTVYLDSSPYEELDSFRWFLFGIYLFPTIVCPCCFPLPLPHGFIHAFLEEPSQRWVRVRVERSHQQQDEDLGFWRVRRPTIEATAATEMEGTIWQPDSFDFRLIQ